MDKPMRAELRKCPFCGNDARWAIAGGGDDSWEIQCSNNDCCIVLFAGNTSAETVAAWNHRPVEDALRRALEAIRAHHVEQNRLKGRPIENSHTIAICDAALREGL